MVWSTSTTRSGWASHGTVTWRNSRQLAAPSTRPASYSSPGIPSRAASSRITASGNAFLRRQGRRPERPPGGSRYVLTAGGPGTATTTLVWQAYLATFDSLDFGLGNAYAYTVSLITLGWALVYFHLLYRRGEFET